MALVSPKSPKWRKPSAIRLKKHRRASSVVEDTPPTDDTLEKMPEIHCRSSSVKRKNPFRSDNVTKRRTSEASVENLRATPAAESSQSSALFSFLNSSEKFFEEDSLESFSFQSRTSTNTSPIASSPASQSGITVNQPQHFDQSHAVFRHPSHRPDQSSIKPQTYEQLPTDWSIKTKMRFLSTASFDWCTNTRSCDSAGGLSTFIRNSCAPETQSESPLDSSKEADLQGCLLYWCHPHLPWMRPFPRIVPDNKFRITSVLDEDMKSSLKSDWCESMSSLFQLLRNGHCSHFYVCTHQFTVLFLSAKQGRPLQSVISPSTRGLREALSAEGIEFTLPLHRDDLKDEFGDEKSDVTKRRIDKLDAVENDCEESDAAASVWLESMGVSKEEFPTLDPTRVKLQRDSFRSIDNRVESTVVAVGTEVQGVFNFLLNWRSCFALSGSQAGIPPTILSGCPFKGGTLHSLRYKQTTARQENEAGRLQQINVLEISGVVLPANLRRLCGLFTRTQGCYAASFVSHEPTAAFNRVAPASAEGTEKTEQAAMFDGKLDDPVAISEVSRDGQEFLTENRLRRDKNANVDERNCERDPTTMTLKSVEYRDDRYTCAV